MFDHTDRRHYRAFAIFATLSTGFGAMAQPPLGEEGLTLPAFDIRLSDAAIVAEREAILGGEAQLARRNEADAMRLDLPGLRVSFGSLWGSPEFIRSIDGQFLTTPEESPDDPAQSVRAFIAGHTELFGVTPAEFDAAALVKQAYSENTGLWTMRWRQEIGGVPVEGCELRASVTDDGVIVSVGSRFVPEPAGAVNAAAAAVSRIQAIQAACASVVVTPGGEFEALDELAGAQSLQRFVCAGDGVDGEVFTRLVYFPITPDNIRLAIETTLQPAGDVNRYRILVDAVTGAILSRESLTVHAGPTVTYRVWADATTKLPFDSPAPLSPGPSTPDGTQGSVISRELITLDAFDAQASQNGWVDTGQPPIGTRGNNVRVQQFGVITPPSSTNPLEFDYTINLNNDPSTYLNAAASTAFYAANWYHDRIWQLGFREADGNFQEVNPLGTGGVGGDSVRINVQIGALNGAAFFGTPTDGDPVNLPTIIMGVFTGPNPDRDSQIDNTVLFHELTHGTATRLAGFTGGMSNSFMPHGLQEGWADFVALSLLSTSDEELLQDRAYPVGAYITLDHVDLQPFDDNYYFGIRRYPYTTDVEKNPLTLNDLDVSQFDADPSVPSSILHSDIGEVHNMGEVWASALWECRSNLIARPDLTFDEANELMLRLVIEGMKGTPALPTFIDARDAIILAAQTMKSVPNVELDLWRGFAKRGMGFGGLARGAIDAEDSFSVVRVSATESANLLALNNGVSDGGQLDRFGESVSLSGDTLFVGAKFLDISSGSSNDGGVYVYEWDGSSWISQPRLESPNLGVNNEFGASVAVSGDVAVVGEPAASNSGRAHVFRRDTNGDWNLEQTLSAGATIEAGARFGDAVAVYDDWIAVGAWAEDDSSFDTGAVYVFEYDAQASPVWTNTQRLIAFSDSDPFNNRFGRSVSLSGDALLVGASLDSEVASNAGRAFAFRLNSGTWQSEQVLVGSDLSSGDSFGRSVSVTGNSAIIGAPDGGSSDEGAAYVFRFDGVDWIEEDRLRPITGETQGADGFGISVSISGDQAIIGASLEGGTDIGAAYITRRSESPNFGVAWALERISPARGAGDQFGHSVAANGIRFAIGAHLDDISSVVDQGSVFVFDSDGIDCDGNGLDDALEIANDASLDNDSDGVLDSCNGTAADLNGDGVVDGADLAQLLANWGPCPSCAADLNGDDEVNGADLAQLLANWG